MRDAPEWRNWQTRLTQNQVLRSVGSSPTSGTDAKRRESLKLSRRFIYTRLYPRTPECPRATGCTHKAAARP